MEDERRRTNDGRQTTNDGRRRPFSRWSLVVGHWSFVVGRNWAAPLNPLLLVYLVLTLTAFFVSPLPERSLPYLAQAGGGVAGFLVVYAWLDSPARLRGLFQALVLAGGALALAGLFLVEWPSQYLFDLRPLLSLLPRPPVPFSIHPNALAGILLLPACLAGGVWRLEMSRWRRAWLAAAILLIALMLALTQSRNAWLALLAAWVAYHLWGRFRFAYLALGLGALIAFPLTVNLLPEQGLTHLERGAAFVDNLTKSGEADEPSWLSRLELWRAAGQTLADYPAVGAGLHTFEPASRANYVYAVVSPQFNFTHAHNLFWQTAVNLGFAGLLTAVCLWGVALWGLWSRRPPSVSEDDEGRTTNDQRSLFVLRPSPFVSEANWAAVVGAALVGYLWFNLFDLIAWEQLGAIFFWLLLAAALRLGPAQKTARPALLAGVCLAVWLVLLLAPSGGANWRRLQLDQARFAQTGPPSVSPTAFANDARRLGLVYFLRQDAEAAVAAWQADEESVPFLRQQGIAAFYAGEWETAVVWHHLALRLDPTDGLTHYWLGRAYHIQDDPAPALAHYDLALTNLLASAAPALLAEIWEARGRVLAQMADWEAAADSFAQAVALFPDNPDYAQQLRQVNFLLQGEE
jgi:O-antigen ligase